MSHKSRANYRPTPNRHKRPSPAAILSCGSIPQVAGGWFFLGLGNRTVRIRVRGSGRSLRQVNGQTTGLLEQSPQDSGYDQQVCCSLTWLIGHLSNCLAGRLGFGCVPHRLASTCRRRCRCRLSALLLFWSTTGMEDSGQSTCKQAAGISSSGRTGRQSSPSPGSGQRSPDPSDSPPVLVAVRRNATAQLQLADR